MRYVILRTHGGLGNQLFQILFGRLLAENDGLTLREVHDFRYRHAFPRSEELLRADDPDHWQRLVSAMRLPKLLQRLTGRPVGSVRIGGTVYLDAYFQSGQDYRAFPPELVARHLERLAIELNIGPADLNADLIHLRLGDFFADRNQALLHVKMRLAKVLEGSSIITNDESLLQEPEVAAIMMSRALKLVSTKAMLAEDVLRVMARYRSVNANDSTLAFWSSVLGGVKVTLRNPGLHSCHELLIDCRKGFVA